MLQDHLYEHEQEDPVGCSWPRNVLSLGPACLAFLPASLATQFSICKGAAALLSRLRPSSCTGTCSWCSSRTARHAVDVKLVRVSCTDLRSADTRSAYLNSFHTVWQITCRDMQMSR